MYKRQPLVSTHLAVLTTACFPAAEFPTTQQSRCNVQVSHIYNTLIFHALFYSAVPTVKSLFLVLLPRLCHCDLLACTLWLVHPDADLVATNCEACTRVSALFWCLPICNTCIILDTGSKQWDELTSNYVGLPVLSDQNVSSFSTLFNSDPDLKLNYHNILSSVKKLSVTL